jgi:hypothetical protein
MSWCGIAGLLVKREAPSNSKMKRLCRLLDIPLYQAVGLLELLWHLTAREATRGDIGKLSNEDIALALDYRGDENMLIDALVRTHWLDENSEHRLVIHEWHEHADEAVKKRLTRSGRTFITIDHVETESQNVETKPQFGNLPRAGAGPEPEPEPHPGELAPSALSAAADDFEFVSKDDTNSSTRVDVTQSLSKTEVPKKATAPRKWTPEDYVSFWNSNCAPFSKVRKLTPKRLAKLKKRIQEGLTPARFAEALRIMCASPHCVGDGPRGWRASFNFVITIGNLDKILDGNYNYTPAKKTYREIAEGTKSDG